MNEFPERHNSAQLFEEAKHYFPGGVNSPVRAFKSVFGPPLFIKEGSGCRIKCEDDYEYIDFCASWGPLILGHNDPDVRAAIHTAVDRGTSFGAPTRRGNELGALILQNHRFLEQIRFVSSGTEAVMSAIRLARGFTGKTKIIKFEGCYHGHVDSLLVKAGSGLATFGVSSSAGIPANFIKETIVLPLDDSKAVEEAFANNHDIAAVIIEPIPANNGLLLQSPLFLQKLRELCTNYGSLLIFDEVISGFRVGFEGAAGHYQIKPDILTFGKIIGGGLPVGAFGARREIMQHISPVGNVYQAGTLSANPVAMAAGYATLQKILSLGFYEQLNAKTTDFVGHLNQYVAQKGYALQIEQIGSIFWLNFSRNKITRADQIAQEGMEYFKHLHLFLLRNGVYLGPSGYEVGFVSYAHDQVSLEKAAETIIRGLDYCFTSKI
ncbi:MAG: glutamate-1-semialdehyde 2,1-aminomutase [Saprospiraceae bacterium]|nr:glutamate-1-semialdehyde 2,1-aminomutase [Saprospiraceae bacterium]